MNFRIEACKYVTVNNFYKIKSIWLDNYVSGFRIFFTMTRAIITFIFTFIMVLAEAQTTTTDGSWQNSANWNATYPGSGTDGDGTLNLDGETINLDNYITLGSSASRVNVNVAGSNFAGEFIVNDTTIIFGDVVFQNKAMELTVTSNGVLIVFGDLTMNNKISVDSDGVIVVTGTFTMSGSGAQNDYSGSGNVYAGSYGGNAENEIDDSGDGNGDSSFTIDNLSDDGYGDIEDYVSGGGDTPLPVEFLFFKGKYDGAVTLTWATASEKDNDRFEIERSDDGSYFYTIDEVDGFGTTNEQVNYSYKDHSSIGSVSYYRLRQVDYDGVYDYSETIRVETENEAGTNSFTIYPTNVQSTPISINANRAFEVRDLKVFGLSGATQERNVTFERVHTSEVKVNTATLQRGIYLLRLTTSEGEVVTRKFVVQ